MKNPLAVTALSLLVLVGAGLAFYFYGLPMLGDNDIGCRYGGGTKSLGCSSSFGVFMTMLSAAVALLLAGIWNRFGRY